MIRFLLVSTLALLALRAQAPLPLPDGPVRLVIPEAAAFDAALRGGYRDILHGEVREGDPLLMAWRRTQVGSKLENQWSQLSADLPWTWGVIRQLQPRSVGLAILDVGHLEAVLVIETPLARLPVALPPGQPGSYGGVTYALVARGAADGSDDKDRRMGLAWARLGGRLILATSERALRKTLDEALAGRGFKAPLPGLVAMELNLDELRRDRYFRREFPSRRVRSRAASAWPCARSRVAWWKSAKAALTRGAVAMPSRRRGSPPPAGTRRGSPSGPRSGAPVWSPCRP